LFDISVKYNILGAKLLGFGGSLYVALETAIAFLRRGYSVCFDPIFMHERFSKEIPVMSRIYGIPLEELSELAVGKCDPASLSINSTGDFLSGKADVVYLHYPSFLKPEVYYEGLDGVYSIAANIYYVLNLLYRPFALKRAKVFIANSSFTKHLLERALGVRAALIYPPVNVKDLISQEPLPHSKREQFILSVSRLSYEKQPHRIILIARILHNLGLHDWKVVCAGTSSKYADVITRMIYELAWRKGVRNYVVIYRDLSREELIELYRKAYIYVHLTPREHFGISIVEAMAAGTPVIIPKDNGAWIDVANRNSSILLTYSSLPELAKNVKLLVEDVKEWSKLSRNARLRAEYFKRERFHKELVKLVESVFNT